MAYLALARKWRPKAFSEVVGQQHVVQALSNALDTGRVHHAFLFTGTRGVGKTTLARIFAKSLNCEEGTSAEPCQQCGTCKSIDEGRFVDLIEVDAASRTKVDETRELLENVQYAPTSGKFKVYLIDEVHMFSGHSFNALLKTLEEPPEHVKFLFATTDPQKLPVTVLSRCLQFNLRAMRPEQVENQLVKILSSEGIEYDAPALQAISRAADGSMRDGLSLLDQAIAQGGGQVRLDNVQGMLGTIKSEHTQSIVDALLSNNIDSALKVVADMADNAVDFSVALDEVLMQLYYISMAQASPNSVGSADVDVNKIKDLARKVDPETLQLFYQIGLISKRDISLAPSLRVGFEMALLRMFAFEPAENTPSSVPSVIVSDTPQAADPAAPADQTAAQESQATAEKKTLKSAQLESAQVGGTSDSAPLQAQQAEQAEQGAEPQNHSEYSNSNSGYQGEQNSVPEHQAVPPWEEQTQGEPSHNTPLPNPLPESPQSQSPQPQSNQSQGLQSQSSGASVPLENQAASTEPSLIAVTLAGNNEWGELIEQTSLVGMAKELAMNCAADRMSDQRIDLCLSAKLEHLHSQQRFEEIQAAVQAAVNPQIAVQLEIADSDRETPSECLSRLGYEHEEQVRDQMHSDPGLQSIMSEFDATIKENSIKPIS